MPVFRPLVPPNLQHVVKEIIDFDCPEGATFSERSLRKSIVPYPLQIAISPAYNGFVSVLEKLTMAPAPFVIRYRIAREQPSHQAGNTLGTTSKQKMCMI